MEFGQRRRVELNTGQDPRIGLGPVRGQRLGTGSSGRLRDRRKPRQAGLFAAMHRLDMALDPAARAELTRWVRDEYDTQFGDVPLGFVAVCHLGPPYVDHRLDLFRSIVDHFGPADAMPEPFARARMLVRTGAYEYVEVYASGELQAVRPDGSVVP